MDPRSAKPNRRPYHLHLIVRACGSAVVATLFGVIALAFAIACAPRIVEAAPLTTYTWTGTGSGGVWQNGSLGHFDTVYSNSPSSAATFTGTAETVTVSGTVEAAALTFLTGGYMLSGGTVAFAAGQITTTPGITTIDSALSGSGTLSVGGTGTLHLGSDSRSTLSAALTLADTAVLDLGFAGKVGGDVVLGAGNTLSGSGAVGGTVSGAGNVRPGSSPGILTAAAIAPAGGLSLTFEFDDFGPIYNFATASQNDVLRLTSTTAPFVTSLTSATVVNMFLVETSVIANNSYEGGLFTDLSADFTSSIAAADFRYYVLGDGNGTDASLGGQGYYSFANWKAATSANPALNFVVSTIPRTTEFVIGTPVSGRVMLVTAAVPEPPTYALALSALALAALFGARRRVRGAPRPDFRPALVAAAGLVALAAWLSDSAAASDFAPATFAGDGAGGALTTDAGEAAAHAAAWSQGGMQPLPLLPQPAQAGGLSLAFEFDDSLGGYALPPLREADVVQLTHLAACFAWHKRIDRRTVNAMRLISRLLPTESAGPMPLAPLPEDVTAP